MPNQIVESGGDRLLVMEDEGPTLARLQEMLDLIGEALSQRASVIVVPVARLDPEFFRLRSGTAGEFTQKVVNYGLRLAILGHLSAFTAGSTAFADYLRESNRGGNVFFLPDLDALKARLAALAAGS